MLDPTTIWLYRGALAAIILLALVGALLGVSKLGSAHGISGLRGFVAWAVTDGKSYGLALAGSVATAAYALGYLSWDHWIIVMGLVNGTAIGTLRAAQGKTIEMAKTAAQAAEEAASVATVRDLVQRKAARPAEYIEKHRVSAAPGPAGADAAIVPKPRED